MGLWQGSARGRCVCALCLEEREPERLCVTAAPVLGGERSVRVCSGVGLPCARATGQDGTG